MCSPIKSLQKITGLLPPRVAPKAFMILEAHIFYGKSERSNVIDRLLLYLHY